MMRWLVMPRGINVGKINRVPMAELCALLEDAGFGDVLSIGQSGNIIVTASRPEEKVCASVRALMASAFGVDVPVMARSADEIRAILDANPLQGVAADSSKYLSIFLSTAPSQAQAAALEAENFSPEVVRIHGRTAFVWTPDGVKAMRVSHTALEKRFRVTATVRNWNTLEKIAAKF